MSYYIVCHKKRNNPRMDVRICETKCTSKEECKEFAIHREGRNQAPPCRELPESAERRAA